MQPDDVFSAASGIRLSLTPAGGISGRYGNA